MLKKSESGWRLDHQVCPWTEREVERLTNTPTCTLYSCYNSLDLTVNPTISSAHLRVDVRMCLLQVFGCLCYLSREVSTCVVMSLSGPCVSKGSPAGWDVLEEVVSGCWGLTDRRHLRKTTQMQNVSSTYRREIRLFWIIWHAHRTFLD